ncbi:putative sodium/potassium-transporting ATPase subunit beta-3, partial [Stegodyphus mimosarum]
MNEKNNIRIARSHIMAHNKSYTVSTAAGCPQPYVTVISEKGRHTACCSGWTASILAGIVAIFIILALNYLGGSKIFLVPFDPYAGLEPIMKQGRLQVYPFQHGISTGIKTIYSTSLPQKNIKATLERFQQLLTNYPLDPGERYRNCWLANPTSENPCYFDPRWIEEVCSKNDSYGYEEINGNFSPCFILKFDKLKLWEPLLVERYYLPPSVMEDYDPSFVPVTCSSRNDNGSYLPNEILKYPPKGFSHLYFPEAKFNPIYYLPPLVAVRIQGISKGTNVTVECSIIARNSFLLWDNGIISITFQAA